MPTNLKPVSTVLVKQDVRSANAIERTRTQQRAKLRNYQTIESVAQEQQVLAARTKEYRSRSNRESRDTNASAGRQSVVSAVGRAPTAAGSNAFVLILFTMFGLIVFYTLVTNPSQSNTFFGSLSNWLSLVSTSTPIFQKKVT